MTVLVIGYGNPLCSDDGLGPQIAARLMAWQWPQLQVITRHQLVPELADSLAKVDRAIFIDAASKLLGEPIQIQALHPQTVVPTLGHTCDPRFLLALAQTLYGQCPDAWWVQVAAQNLQVGDRLSPQAETLMVQALAQIKRLLEQERLCTKSV